MAARAQFAVPECRATLDALHERPGVGADGAVGFWGINMGTWGFNMGTVTGVPLMAIEPRIKAVVFGRFRPDALADRTKRITIPIESDMRWDDEYISREEGLALFDAFASKEKSLHVNSGQHKERPRFGADSAVRFFTRYLGSEVTSPA
ncbi:hypothetical protein ABZY02_16325 [Streptomyces sp. NPDC006649]|uniref:hypothetical protein n=1 Tax=Streptomyces sp. NPDC006649 TaxID=3156896 RepID=UPI0033A55B84